MRRMFRVSVRLSLIPIVLAAAFALPSVQAPAQETFMIQHDEAYGIAQCLSARSLCARTVADAWCAAMGRGPSTSLSLAEDEPPTTETVTDPPRQSGLRVTCG